MPAESLDLAALCAGNSMLEGQTLPRSMPELVEAWLTHAQSVQANQSTQDDDFSQASEIVTELVKSHPEIAMNFVIAALAANPELPVQAYLAAGPLEDVLGEHGPMLISKVELLARHDPGFKVLLGFVWKRGMGEDIWQRVLVASGRTADDYLR